MKSLKLIVSVLFITLLSSQAYSQLSLGGQVSYLNLFGGTGIKSFGIGIKGDYALDDRTVLTGGFNYYLPSKFSNEVYGNAYSSETSPSQIIIESENKISFMHIYFGAKRYFVGDYEDDFGFYGLAEVGILLAPTSTTLEDFNENKYYSTVDADQRETLSNFTINFGVGVEKDIDFGYLFADLKLNLPANQANGQAVAVDIPFSASINLGVRIPL